MKTKLNMAQRNRKFNLLFRAFNEEVKHYEIPREEIRKRLTDMIESCYGDLPKEQRRNINGEPTQ